MPRQSTKSVSERSTKQEIFAAYQEMLGEIADQPLTQGTVARIEKQTRGVLDNLKEAGDYLKITIDKTLSDLTGKFSETEAIVSELTKLQERQKKALEEEKQLTVKDQSRQKEEFAYEFSKQKKRTEEELAEMRTKTEAELNERRAKLKEQEDELTELRNQAKTFEPRLQKSVNDAVAQSAKELKLAFDHEKAILTQEAKSTQSLLEQKVALLEQTISRQAEEINRLNTTATSASQQLTRIAERAVTKSPEPPPAPPMK